MDVAASKLSFTSGLRHQVCTTLLSLYASVGVLLLAAAIIFSLGALSEPSLVRHASTKNESEWGHTFATYSPQNIQKMYWFVGNCGFGSLLAHFTWWGFTKHIYWGKRKEFVSYLISLISFLILFNGALGVLRTANTGGITLWGIIAVFFLVNILTESLCMLYCVGGSVWSAVVQGFLATSFYFTFMLLVLLYIIASLRMEDEVTRAIILGIVYPGGKVALKFMYRKHALAHNEAKERVGLSDAKIREQGFIYVARNLEVLLGKPNIYLIFLLETRAVFMATLAVSCLCEFFGMIASNMRFTRAAQNIRTKLAERIKITPEKDTGPSRNGKQLVQEIVAAKEMERNKMELAIIRNGEDIAEMTLIVTSPIIIMMMIFTDFAHAEYLTVAELAARAAIAFSLESFVDVLKVHADDKFGVRDYLVHNRMNLWDIINMATIGSVAENIFIFAVLYTNSDF